MYSMLWSATYQSGWFNPLFSASYPEFWGSLFTPPFHGILFFFFFTLLSSLCNLLFYTDFFWRYKYRKCTNRKCSPLIFTECIHLSNHHSKWLFLASQKSLLCPLPNYYPPAPLKRPHWFPSYFSFIISGHHCNAQIITSRVNVICLNYF